MNRQTAHSKFVRTSAIKSAQHGVGLIEVLIAVLVLSIGVLGLAGLQMRALADNGSSLNRSAATAASYSILEAMRLDRASALNGDYNRTAALGNVITTNNCPAVSTTLASFQLNNWCSRQLANFLGTVSTTKGMINCTATGVCEIRIEFDESRSAGGNVAQTLITKAAI